MIIIDEYQRLKSIFSHARSGVCHNSQSKLDRNACMVYFDQPIDV